MSGEPGERDGHNKLKKSNSIAVTDRRGVSTAPSTHSGPTGPPDGKNATGKSFIQRRRLRQPVWARSVSQKKLLPFLLLNNLQVFSIFLRSLNNSNNLILVERSLTNMISNLERFY